MDDCPIFTSPDVPSVPGIGWHRDIQHGAAGACGCVTNAGYEIAFFLNKFTTKAIGIGTRRAADPMWTGMRTRVLAHPAAPDSLLRF
jgi:hypothetical protein